MKLASFYKCKVPHGGKCRLSHECPHLNKCIDGVCIGSRNAFCTNVNQCMTSDNLECKMNVNHNNQMYGMATCKKVRGKQILVNPTNDNAGGLRFAKSRS